MRICHFRFSGVLVGILVVVLQRLARMYHFVSRGAHYEAMRENGLAVTSISGDFHLDPVNVVQLPQQAAPFDMVLVAVKAWQVTETAKQ